MRSWKNTSDKSIRIGQKNNFTLYSLQRFYSQNLRPTIDGVFYIPGPARTIFMKKLFLTWLILLGLSISATAFADFGYPLSQIAKPSCRKDAWSTLDDSCKMTLPRIVGADYQKYKNDTQYRRIYTVLW